VTITTTIQLQLQFKELASLYDYWQSLAALVCVGAKFIVAAALTGKE